MSIAGCPLGRFECAICGDTAKVFAGWDLVEKIRQHWSVTYTAGCHFNCAYLQGFFVDPTMYLAPKAALGDTMFARIPLTFSLSLDANTLYQQM